MGANQSKANQSEPKPSRRRIPNVRFRVLIIGRANAGKTTILQKVCDTTESPTIYKKCGDGSEREEVCHAGLTVLPLPVSSYATHRLNLTHQWRLVTRGVVRCRSLTLSQRGEHDIDDELVFSNHTGYVFHDSRGIESGAIDEVDILREFIRSKASARRLQSKLHAIWFGLLCVNDND